MKIHSIRIKNINSLYGEHDVDLEGVVGDVPIFLVMGPTGAGKSTIFDALALALFGVTPRLGGTYNDAQSGIGRLISAGEGEAFAEVEFSIRGADGVRTRYRARIEVWRARKKADGDVQAPRRALWRLGVDANGSQTFECLVEDTRRKYFDPPFNEALRGLEFDDFQRSVLLPQGEFAAFLGMAADARSRLLTRLTRTEVYREIGRRCAERNRSIRSTIERMEAQQSEVRTLDSDERAQLTERLGEVDAARTGARTAYERATKSVAWMRRSLELDASLDEARAALERAQEAEREAATRINRWKTFVRSRPAIDALNRAEETDVLYQAVCESVAEAEKHSTRVVAECETHEAHAKAAHKVLARAEEAHRVEQPQIRRAFEAHQAVSTHRREVERISADLQNAVRAHAKAEGQQTEARSHVEASEAAYTRARAVVDAEPLGDELSAVIATLTAQTDAFEEARARLKSRREALAAEEARRPALEKQRRDLRAAHDTALKTFKDAQVGSTTALEAFAAILEGQPEEDVDADIDRRRAALERRGKDIAELVSLVAQSERQQLELDELDGQLRNDDEAFESLSSRVAEQHAAAEAAERALKSEEQRAQTLDVVLGVVAEGRSAALRDGEPCLLCGSDDHPYISGARPVPSDAAVAELVAAHQARIAAHQCDLNEATASHTVSDRELSALRGTRDERAKRRARVAAAIEASQGAIDAPRQRLGLPSSVLTSMELEPLEQTLERDREILDARSQTLREARNTAHRARDTLRDAEVAEERARRELRSAEEEIERLVGTRLPALREEQEEASALYERARSAVVATLARVDDAFVPDAEATGADMRTYINKLEKRQAAFVAATNERMRTERALVDAREALATANATWASATQNRDAVRVALSEREAELSAAVEAATAFYDGRSPEDVAAQLVKAVDDSRADAQRADVALQSARKEEAVARTTLTQHQERMKELAVERDERAAAFDVACRALGLAPSRSEVRLTDIEPDERAGFEATALAIESMVRDATNEIQRLERDRVTHQEARPSHLGDDATLESEAAELERADAEVERWVREAGGLSAQLEADNKARERRDELASALDEARSEGNLWESMHSLIGVNNGESFERFAQAIGLQELVTLANHRLKHLAPRYELAVAREKDGVTHTLDFAVRDYETTAASDIHGELRPVSTLSGGETFLVSLALTLAFSDFRRVSFQADTLLLDEGFGTLDQETLEIAISALERLSAQQRAQIGVISHVEALKERIPARVVVSRVSAGRSAVTVIGPG